MKLTPDMVGKKVRQDYWMPGYYVVIEWFRDGYWGGRDKNGDGCNGVCGNFNNWELVHGQEVEFR